MAKFDSEESVFNMALAYLARIDKLLYKCQESALVFDIDKWVGYLRGVFRELSAKLNEKEIAEIAGKYDDEFNIEELTDENITDKEATFRNIYRLINNREYRKRYRSKILFLLDALEIKIRKSLQAKGMLLPSKSDPRYAVLNR